MNKTSGSQKRRRSSDTGTRASQAAAAEFAGSTALNEAASPSRPRTFIPALVAFGLWGTLLVALAIFTANPTTLNRAQIGVAPVVLEATPRNKGEDQQWQVSRSWPATRVEPTVTIRGLDPVNVTGGQPYLIPVEPIDRDEYRLVLSPRPFAAPFIYPATPETISQLQAIREK